MRCQEAQLFNTSSASLIKNLLFLYCKQASFLDGISVTFTSILEWWLRVRPQPENLYYACKQRACKQRRNSKSFKGKIQTSKIDFAITVERVIWYDENRLFCAFRMWCTVHNIQCYMAVHSKNFKHLLKYVQLCVYTFTRTTISIYSTA